MMFRKSLQYVEKVYAKIITAFLPYKTPHLFKQCKNMNSKVWGEIHQNAIEIILIGNLWDSSNFFISSKFTM